MTTSASLPDDRDRVLAEVEPLLRWREIADKLARETVTIHLDYCEALSKPDVNGPQGMSVPGVCDCDLSQRLRALAEYDAAVKEADRD